MDAFLQMFEDSAGKTAIAFVLHEVLSRSFDIGIERKLAHTKFIITRASQDSTNTDSLRSISSGSSSVWEPQPGIVGVDTCIRFHEMDLGPPHETSSSQGSPCSDVSYERNLKGDILIRHSATRSYVASISVKSGRATVALYDGQLKCELLAMLASAKGINLVVGAVVTAREAILYQAKKLADSNTVEIQLLKTFNLVGNISTMADFFDAIVYRVEQPATG